jgi:peptidoglycan/xylan/chitin deacetylase (PgdA/CDA1 family)
MPAIIFVITLIAASGGLATVALGRLVPGVEPRPIFGIAAAVFMLLEAVLLIGVFERRAPIFGRIFWKGKGGRRTVSLTFDDGPNEPFTSQILDVLKRCGVRATFFVIGANVERFPDAARRMAAEGHKIGNHTYSHRILPLRTPGFIREEIRRTSELIASIAGARPAFFRAPHGWRNPWVDRVARTEGLVPVAWSLGVWDTDRPGVDAIVGRTRRELSNGCILLLHDGRGTERGADSSQVVEALFTIIDEARRAGYEFVGLSEMMKEEAAR